MSPTVALGFTSSRFESSVGAFQPRRRLRTARRERRIVQLTAGDTRFELSVGTRSHAWSDANYTRAESEAEIVNEVGVRVGSGTAQAYSVSPNLAYEFTPLTNGTLAYRFGHNEVSGGASNDDHGVDFGVSHRFSAVDVGRVDYGFDIFEGSDADTVTSHTVTFGWARELGRQYVGICEARPTILGRRDRARSGSRSSPPAQICDGIGRLCEDSGDRHGSVRCP